MTQFDMTTRMAQGVLRTGRLLLRPFAEADAPRFAELAGERRIADATISVPHPMSLEIARQEIARFASEWQAGTGATFAIVAPGGSNACIGLVALRHIDTEHEEGELSFWIAESAQGHGYVTEAAAAVLDYGFRERGLNRVCAFHMVRNAASGRVLARLGMTQEGCLRQRVRKWGVYEDVLVWAVLRMDRDREIPPQK
jgi:RimJ/RimL family protein N-acetyltransferase